MNQIFRVIWNHATQSWVAVSELTKAHKKQSRNSLKAVLGGALVLCSINTAEAGVAIGSTSDNTLDKGTALASDSGIAIGKNSNASKENNNIAIGDDTNANGAYNIVIGKNAVAGSDGRGNEKRVGQSVAIGGGNKAWEGAKAFGDQSIALGANTLAYGNSSIAIGNDDVDRAVAATTTYTNSDGNKVTGTVGAAYTNLTGKNLHTDGGRYKDTKSGEAAIAIGVKAQAGDISVALGTGSSAEKVNAIAIGSGATATFDNSVALGGGSLTDKEGTKQTSTTVNGHTYNWSGGSTTSKGDIVSFGKKGYERQLKNVAAGEVSETSTDGINGSQLYGILNNMTIDPTFLYAGDDADKGEVTGADADAKKADAATKKIVSRSMKDGRLNLLGGATGELSDNNIGVNYDNENTIKFKLAKDLTGLNSTTVGGIVTNAAGINMNNKPITNLAAGTNPTDAVNKSQLDKVATNNIKLGGDSGTTDAQQLDKTGGLQFNVKGTNGLTTTASGTDVTVKLDDTTKDKIDNAADKNLSNITDAGKKQIKDQVTWKAKADNSGITLAEDTVDTDDTAETIGADGILTLDAGKNLRLQRKGKVFTYGLESDLTGINSITGLASTLPVTKNDAAAPTTNQAAPTKVDGTKAASVNDILNAGWNLKENGAEKDFVKAYDTVNFVNGTGTTANVTVTENGAVSAVKFDVKKTTITPDADKGTVSAADAGDSFATANDVANAINSASWKVTGAEDGGEFAEGNTTTEEAVKAGDKVTFKAGENIKLKQAGKDFTYSLNPVLSNITSIGGNGTTMTFKDAGVDLGGKKITNIAPGTDGKDAVNKSQLDTAVQEVAAKPLSFSGDNKEAGKFDRTLGTEVKVVGGETEESKLSDNNIGVIGNKTDTLTVKLAKSLKGLSSVEVKDDAGNTTNITPNGITISQPAKDGKKPNDVSLTKDGLNNGGQNITNVAGNLPGAKKDTTAPTTSSEAPSATDLPNIINNAATVGDVLNAGWNLQNNGEAKDFVKPYDTVNFIDGESTTAVVTTTDNKVSTVKYDVKLGAGLKKDDKGNITVDAGNITNENGAPKVADADKDKVATAGNVADAINNSYWTASAEKDGKVIGQDDNIKPSGKVTFDAGKNIEIDHSTPNKFTFKTVDNPEFKTLDLNDGAGNKVNLAPTADGLKLGKGDKNEPANITNVTSGLKPYGDAKPDAKDLVNLDTPNVSDNTAATVGDLRNMGWVVGTPENGYVDTVKNANKVDFKAGAGVSVTGETKDGVREITIAVKDGEVVKDGDLTAIVNGESTPVTKVGDKYYKTSDIDPKTGKPVDDKVSAVTPDKGTTPIANAGDGYVTGNKVATAIQKSGFVVGKQTETLSDADFKNEDEKVNPNDELRFADGKNTKVKLATKDTVDREGNKVTTTTVKFDVDTGTVTSNKDGSVSGPVTPEMKKALDDAKKALADATTPEAKKAAQDKVDAAQANIDNVGNPIATVQNIADAINNSGFTLTTSENGGKKLSGKDEIINPGKKVDLAAGKNMTVKQDPEGKVTYATADEVNFSSVQFGDNGPKINAAGDNINIGDKDGNPTKITGVKAGDISPTSTDAVNGAQIYALSRGNVPNVENITVTNPDGSKTTYKDIVVDENGTPILKTYNVQGQKEIITNSVVEAVHNMNEQGIKFFHSNDGVNRPKVETANSFDSSASGKFATAIGKSSVAHGDNAVAMGNGSKVLGNDSIAIGTGNIVEANNSGAFGDPNVIKADATGSYAFGNNNVITTKNTFVLGNDVNNAGNSTSREGTVENSVYLGNKSTATAGDGSRTASLYNIKQDGTKGTSTTAGSVGTVTTATVGNMTYGGFQGAKANGVVSVGAAGDERRIQNVAAGEISSTSTDAINGSQLYSVAKGVGNRINNLQGQVNKLGNRMNAGMATSAAMANLLQAHKPGQSVATAGVGQHKNQSAVAVGYSRLSDNGKYGVRFSMGANTQGEVTGGAAVGYFW
ncbi:hypothetical protein DPV92_01070 [Haemophilus paraphrohaemolyticus]|uniref:Adhesin n=1 Tax=Haemophilus paraphrohaemolyticus TaxID=736 RepID=A0A369ZTP5_9PAST|nr:ESPR-type extended signal peptide-containing protein [Haemophilus paraphrohaemolyticus]RDF11797.1 hypothetical protein DPV92_01070 [Haemophilus paraphrohaemolyticus]